MNDVVYLGIDPGTTGAYALLNSKGKMLNLFTFANKGVDQIAEAMIKDVKQHVKCLAALEQVHSMPNQGVSSTFKFGASYGFVTGLLCALRNFYDLEFFLVRPAEWQGELQCLSGGDKKVTQAAAQQRFPGVRITQKTGDACLIAVYAYKTWRELIKANGKNHR